VPEIKRTANMWGFHVPLQCVAINEAAVREPAEIQAPSSKP
jgi:hypothetical protein